MSVCPCCSPPWAWSDEEKVATTSDVPWTSRSNDKFYLTSDEFTSTIKTSGAAQLFSSSLYPQGHHWDGSHTMFRDPARNVVGGVGPWLRKQSGQFTTTVSDSLDTGPLIDPTTVSAQTFSGISGVGSDTVWGEASYLGGGADRLLKTSGKFTSTVKTSQAYTAATLGLSWDGADTWSNDGTHFIYSGQFTTTVKVSKTWYRGTDYGLCWNGADTLVDGIDGFDEILTKVSGKLTTTIKDSVNVSAYTSSPQGINTNRTTDG